MRWVLGVTMAAVGFSTALSSGGWSTARPVPGVSIQRDAVYTAAGYAPAACSSPQDCTAVYQPTGQGTEVFSVTRHNGTWGAPRRVPGMNAVLGTDLSLACASAGNCVLASDAPRTGGGLSVLVDSLVHGAWGQARAVPGLAALRPGQSAQVSAVACGRAGWCGLAGQTEPTGNLSHRKAFVAGEHNGTWGQARAVPGLAALTGTAATGTTAVACDPRDACTVAGFYDDHSGYGDRPYVVTDRAGQWGKATAITGTSSTITSDITALSCPAPGDCSAAGTTGNTFTSQAAQLFTVTEAGGTWHPAAPLSGTLPLQHTADTQTVTALTCTAPDQCTALGSYAMTANSSDGLPVEGLPFAATQVHGTWSPIREVHGLPADPVAQVNSVSCASAGNCAAGGYWYSNPDGDEHTLSNATAFVVSETGGTWGKAQRVPGLLAKLSQDSATNEVACASHGCTAIGQYLTLDRRFFTSTRP